MYLARFHATEENGGGAEQDRFDEEVVVEHKLRARIGGSIAYNWSRPNMKPSPLTDERVRSLGET
ncbi:hypothetical protein ACMD2_16441 [Ananas comosus]|uniref:Uncharacterized protein n=1 Tax=Ananas comosus TaxID=4615 RepID=A0A199UNA9_ANACO|nr:hypothetical protein ACMD2_16441 [Ananas comosus]